jgi:hypothetical protein
MLAPSPGAASLLPMWHSQSILGRKPTILFLTTSLTSGLSDTSREITVSNASPAKTGTAFDAFLHMPAQMTRNSDTRWFPACPALA